LVRSRIDGRIKKSHFSYKDLLCDRKNNFRANGNIAGVSRTSTCETKTIADGFARSFSTRDTDLNTDWRHEIEQECSGVESPNRNILIAVGSGLFS
jgi:hypothetical protein